MQSEIILAVASVFTLGFLFRLYKEVTIFYDMHLTKVMYQVEESYKDKLSESEKLFLEFMKRADKPLSSEELIHYIYVSSKLHDDLINKKELKSLDKNLIERLNLLHQVEFKILFSKNIK